MKNLIIVFGDSNPATETALKGINSKKYQIFGVCRSTNHSVFYDHFSLNLAHDCFPTKRLAQTLNRIILAGTFTKIYFIFVASEIFEHVRSMKEFKIMFNCNFLSVDHFFSELKTKNKKVSILLFDSLSTLIPQNRLIHYALTKHLAKMYLKELIRNKNNGTLKILTLGKLKNTRNSRPPSFFQSNIFQSILPENFFSVDDLRLTAEIDKFLKKTDDSKKFESVLLVSKLRISRS